MNCHGLSWIYKNLIVSATAIGKNQLEIILDSKWSLPRGGRTLYTPGLQISEHETDKIGKKTKKNVFG